MWFVQITDISNSVHSYHVKSEDITRIVKILTKKHFWKNKVISFDVWVYDNDIKEYKWAGMPIYRAKNIIRFFYKSF